MSIFLKIYLFGVLANYLLIALCLIISCYRFTRFIGMKLFWPTVIFDAFTYRIIKNWFFIKCILLSWLRTWYITKEIKSFFEDEDKDLY